ncbi:hypothetical protein [Peijinzhouia sedimentorum]
MANRRWKMADKKQLQALRKKGYSREVIADLMKLTITQIDNAVQRFDLKKEKSKKEKKMPKINQPICLDLSVESFVRQCSEKELYELHLQMQTPRVAKIIEKIEESASIKKDAWNAHREQLEGGRFP